VTFTGLLDTFKGFFSRAFWFSRFLPVLLIAAAHATLASRVYGWQPFGAGTGEAKGGVAALIAKVLPENSGEAMLTFAALVVLAYALGPAIPLIGSILDGSLLPAWLHNRLRKDRRTGWVETTKAQDNASGHHTRMEEALETWKEALIAARKLGAKTKTISDQAAIESAEKAVAALTGQLEPDPDEMDKAGRLLKTALSANSAELRHNPASDDPANPSKEISVWSLRLSEAQGRFRGLLKRLLNEAAHQQRAASARLGAADPSDLQPTRFGDVRFALDRYVKHAYGAPLNYLWPRVRMSIPADTSAESNTAAKVVGDSTAQSDFAVALFALWWTVPLLWLPLAVAAEPPDPVVAGVLGLAAPIIGWGLYELAVQAEIATGNAIATALDQHRRGALVALGLDPPRTLSGERELWRKLDLSGEPNNGVELVYPLAPKSD
jgi:hypothetical protein